MDYQMLDQLIAEGYDFNKNPKRYKLSSRQIGHPSHENITTSEELYEKENSSR